MIVISIPRFRARDILFMALCLAGAAAALYLFWKDLNLSLSRYHDDPVGTVTWKWNIAQRHFADRTLWDRLRRESPVYAGDYIHTADLSGVSLLLFGETFLDLQSNTLVQIVPVPEGFTVNLVEGGLAANTGGAGLTIKSGDASLSAGEASVLRAAARAGSLDAALTRGSAVFTQSGASQILRAGDVSPQAVRRVAVLSPRPGAVFLNASEKPREITFSWNLAGFASGGAVRLEIAADRGFSQILRSHDSFAREQKIELENGLYYWRAYPAGQPSREGGVSGRLSVVYAPAPALVSPAPAKVFTFSTTRPGVRFVWTSCEQAAAYLLEVSADAGMTNPVSRVYAQDSGGDICSIVQSGFDAGTWYWRVRPEYSPGCEGQRQTSQTGSFRIQRRDTLDAPSQQFPAEDGSLYLEDKKGEAYFSWQQEEDAASYTFLLSRHADLSAPLIKQKVENNYFVYNLESGNLSPGQYYWGVYQTDSGGADSASSPARMVLIVAGLPPQIAAGQPAGISQPSGISQPAVPLPQAAPKTSPASEAEPLPLAAPDNLKPAAGFTLTEALILRDQKLDFSWDAVPGASGYVFILYQSNAGRRRELLRNTQTQPRFTLTDLAVLDGNTFIWRVEPQARLAGQKSEAGESSFIVSIEETQASRGRESGLMFGNE